MDSSWTSPLHPTRHSSGQPYWCPTEGVALQEAEVYGMSQLSPSLLVKFDLTPETLQAFPELQAIAREEGAIRTSLIVWTTQAWTLPMNRAVLLRPKADYVVIKAPTIDGTELWMVAKELQASFERTVGFGEKTSTPLMTLKAETLNHQKIFHPWRDQTSLIFMGPQVSLSEGTGIEHAVADFRMEEIPSDERSNGAIIDLLQDTGHLAAQTEIQLSDPHCMRCRHPVVRRNTGVGSQLGAEVLK